MSGPSNWSGKERVPPRASHNKYNLETKTKPFFSCCILSYYEENYWAILSTKLCIKDVNMNAILEVMVLKRWIENEVHFFCIMSCCEKKYEQYCIGWCVRCQHDCQTRDASEVMCNTKFDSKYLLSTDWDLICTLNIEVMLNNKVNEVEKYGSLVFSNACSKNFYMIFWDFFNTSNSLIGFMNWN